MRTARIAFVFASAIFGLGTFTFLASPVQADTSNVVQCPNAYCDAGTDFCSYVYRATCTLHPIMPCDNTIC